MPHKDPEAGKAYKLEYQKRPEVAARRTAYMQEYYQTYRTTHAAGIKAKNREWYQGLPESKRAERRAAQNKNLRGDSNRTIVRLRASAKRRGIPFSITETDIVTPEFCAVFGVPLCHHAGGARDNSPSIDKIVPSKGYVKGNVRVISWRANRLKSDCHDPNEFADLAAYVASEMSLEQLIDAARI